MEALTPLAIGLTMGLAFALVVLALAVAWRMLAFPDLTVEGTFLVGASAFAAVAPGHGIAAGMFVSVLAGAVGGAVTALLHLRLGVNKFLAGILTTAILYSVSLVVMGSPNRGLLMVATGGALQTRTQLLLFVFGISAVTATLVGSRVGLRSRVAGSNPPLARMLGISVPLSMMCGLAATNALAAFSGTLVALQQGFVDVGMGQGVLIVALAGMAVGERLVPSRFLPRHVFVVVSAVGGSIVYQILTAYGLTLGVPSTYLKLATAVLVLVVVASRGWRTVLQAQGDAI